MAERPNALVLKTSVGKLTAGSNPAVSATGPPLVPPWLNPGSGARAGIGNKGQHYNHSAYH